MKTFEAESERNLQLVGGVDIGKGTSHVHILTQAGKKVQSGKFLTTESDIREFFSIYREQNLEIALEAGNPTFWMCDILASMNIKTYVVNPLENSYIARSKKKTDKIDAKKLASQLLKDNLPERVYIPTPIQRKLRTLITHRYQYVKERTRTVNRVHSFLSTYGITVKKRTLRESLKSWEDLFSELKDSAPFILEELRLYHREFKGFREGIKDIEARISKLVKKHYKEDYILLLSIPGIGPIIAAAFIAVVGDWTRFKNARRLSSYIGLVPSLRQSGDKNGNGHITKQGNHILRGYLTQGVLSILQNIKKEDGRVFREWYEEIRKRRGWKKARVALCRKLSNIVFGVMKTRKVFDPSLVIKK